MNSKEFFDFNTRRNEIVLKVHTLTSPFYVSDEVLIKTLINKFGEKKGQQIYKDFDEKMLARQRLKKGIYMQDIRQILGNMRINAYFVNEEGKTF